jgi:hypothetical protein
LAVSKRLLEKIRTTVAELRGGFAAAYALIAAIRG